MALNGTVPFELVGKVLRLLAAVDAGATHIVVEENIIVLRPVVETIFHLPHGVEE